MQSDQLFDPATYFPLLEYGSTNNSKNLQVAVAVVVVVAVVMMVAAVVVVRSAIYNFQVKNRVNFFNLKASVFSIEHLKITGLVSVLVVNVG